MIVIVIVIGSIGTLLFFSVKNTAYAQERERFITAINLFDMSMWKYYNEEEALNNYDKETGDKVDWEKFVEVEKEDDGRFKISLISANEDKGVYQVYFFDATVTATTTTQNSNSIYCIGFEKKMPVYDTLSATLAFKTKK